MEPEQPHRKTCRRWNTPWDAHELTFSCYRRRPLLAKERTCGYLADAVNQARVRLDFHVWAYVIMPEHVHLLIWPRREVYSVSAILQAVKQSVSRRALGWLRAERPEGLRWLSTGRSDRPYQFWQEGGGYDRNVRNGKALMDMINYIHNNPVRRGLVLRPEDWKWSSARDWADVAAGPVGIDKETTFASLA